MIYNKRPACKSWPFIITLFYFLMSAQTRTGKGQFKKQRGLRVIKCDKEGAEILQVKVLYYPANASKEKLASAKAQVQEKAAQTKHEYEVQHAAHLLRWQESVSVVPAY